MWIPLPYCVYVPLTDSVDDSQDLIRKQIKHLTVHFKPIICLTGKSNKWMRLKMNTVCNKQENHKKRYIDLNINKIIYINNIKIYWWDNIVKIRL